MNKSLLILSFGLGSLLMTACSGNRSDQSQQNSDSTQSATTHKEPYADSERTNNFEAKLGGATYDIHITRRADKSLPIVTDDLGNSFYDNRVTVRITCGDKVVLNKDYTKEAFADFLSASETKGTVLLGMAYDSSKSDAHTIRLGAQIGQVGIEEGPAFSIEVPLNGGTPSIVRDTAQDTTGDDGLSD